MTTHDQLTIEPRCGAWRDLAATRLSGSIDGVELEQWRRRCKAELGLDGERAVVATGHQSLLWHPGILCKYLVVDAVARSTGMATANLVVDQHVASRGSVGFGEYEVPVRRADGGLAARRVRLAATRDDVPMAMHPTFVPVAPPTLPTPLRSVDDGMAAIVAAVAAHGDERNAALQMAAALARLMSPWVRPMPNVTASQLIETTLAEAILKRMAAEPHRCAAAYNAAVVAIADAGIRPLHVRDDYVELPLWRVMPDGRRLRGFDSDVQRRLSHGVAAARLLPRALFMTALVRTAMCDLFVHGTGGARYDRAMELWMRNWLGIDVAPIAVATATLRLPLELPGGRPIDPATATAASRRARHDPELEGAAGGPGPAKRALLEAVGAAPRGSSRRRAAYFAMHRELDRLRLAHREAVEAAVEHAALATAQADSRPVVERRTWAFPLHPTASIDALAAQVRDAVIC